MSKAVKIYIYVLVIAMMITSTLSAQEYFVKRYSEEGYSLTGRNIEYSKVNGAYHFVATGFLCPDLESSIYVSVNFEGEENFRRTICEIDSGNETARIIDMTMIMTGNNSPVKSNFQVYLLNPLSGDSIQHFQLPIASNFSRQLVHHYGYIHGKHYIAGRGKIDSLGMIPLFYVLNEDLSVDTMMTVDTVFDGRINDMAMTEDSILLVMYDPKEEQVFSSPAYKMVVGYDRDYQEVVRYRSDEEYDLANTTFEYLGNGEIVYYSEEAVGNRVPYLKRVNIYTGEVIWKKVYQHRAFIPDGIAEWRYDSRNIMILSDGNLLITGQMFDSFNLPELHSDSPYFAKVDADTGEILWERLISKNRESTFGYNEHWIGAILDLIEHDNGDLALVGYIGSPEGNELLFLRTDSDGCLEPDCGKYIDLDELVVNNVEVQSDAELVIYPNPVRDHLNIGSVDELLSFDLYSIDGRLMMTKMISGNQVNIDIQSIDSGVYILKLKSNNLSTTTHKIIKL